MTVALRVLALPAAIALWIGSFAFYQRWVLSAATGDWIPHWPELIALPLLIATTLGLAVIKPTRATNGFLVIVSAFSALGAVAEAPDSSQPWLWVASAGVSIITGLAGCSALGSRTPAGA